MKTSVERTIDWLNSDTNLTGYKATAVVPSKRPKRFITVQRTGGVTSQFVDRAGLTIAVYAPTQQEADETGESVVRARLMAMPSVPDVGRVSIESMYEQPDVEAGCPRYEINVQVISLIN